MSSCTLYGRHPSPQPLDADRCVPRRPLVCCMTCYDLPWQRVLRGCPECGGAHRDGLPVRATDHASAREGRYLW